MNRNPAQPKLGGLAVPTSLTSNSRQPALIREEEDEARRFHTAKSTFGRYRVGGVRVGSLKTKGNVYITFFPQFCAGSPNVL